MTIALLKNKKTGKTVMYSVYWTYKNLKYKYKYKR